MKKFPILSLFICLQLQSMEVQEMKSPTKQSNPDMTTSLTYDIDLEQLKAFQELEKLYLENPSLLEDQKDSIENVRQILKKIEDILKQAHWSEKKYSIVCGLCCPCWTHEASTHVRDTSCYVEDNEINEFGHVNHQETVSFDANKIKPLLRKLPWVEGEIESDEDRRIREEPSNQIREAKEARELKEQISDLTQELNWN